MTTDPKLDAFQDAQAPMMWVSAADELKHAAAPIFYGAAEQLPRFEEATRAAIEEADRKLDASSDRLATAKIKAHPPQFLPAFLLYGFAIENLLKGLYVARNPEVIGTEKVGVPATHNLNALANKASYAPPASEFELLRKLTTITTWSGRYPVALTREGYGNTRLNRDAIFEDPVGAGIEMQELVDKLRRIVVPDDPEPDFGRGVTVWKADSTS